MYAYIKGDLVSVADDSIIVDNHGIGYQIFLSQAMIEQLPQTGSEVKIHTYLQVREDAQILFGFLNAQDLAVFKLLIQVNGIGPKGAQAILSVLTTQELRTAILCEDAKAISKAPGVGTKTAQRLIIELKDKIAAIGPDALAMTESGVSGSSEALLAVHAREDAIEALVSLGYSATEAKSAVAKVQVAPAMTGEQVLKESLKHISI
ncbi:MAG: Holliday junction branch migration protein RuvA [Lachnospiraceae bacterium]